MHKIFLVATLLLEGGKKKVARFGTDQRSILEFKEWLSENNCGRAVIESTGIFWVPVYVVLEDEIEIVVANSYQVKQIPGRKTDESDSEWLAMEGRGWQECDGLTETHPPYPEMDCEAF